MQDKLTLRHFKKFIDKVMAERGEDALDSPVMVVSEIDGQRVQSFDVRRMSFSSLTNTSDPACELLAICLHIDNIYELLPKIKEKIENAND